MKLKKKYWIRSENVTLQRAISDTSQQTAARHEKPSVSLPLHEAFIYVTYMVSCVLVSI
jgi:hypothetical protein